METLSHSDILALNNAIGEIYSARDMESFHRSLFSSVQEIVASEHSSFSDVILTPTLRFRRGSTASQDHHHVYKKLITVLNAHIHEHPSTPHILSDKVIKTTDFASKSHFKGLAIYNEYYKHLDIETQMNLTIPVSREKILIFTLSRKGQDFSERDRAVLTLLKPHLISAFRNVTELGRMRLERDLLQKGTEAERQGALLFQSDGTVLCLSPLAKEMISRYFDAPVNEGDLLPGRLLRWFKAEADPPAKGGNLKRIERNRSPLRRKTDA